MSSSSERNDRRRAAKWAAGKGFHGRGEAAGDCWIWGWHAVVAALGNPAREPPRRLLASPGRAKALTERFAALKGVEVMDAGRIGQALPPGAAHQGVAMEAPPPPASPIEALASPAAGVLLMLDQVTDPQNVGAIFRSAAAFGAKGVILQDRHAPTLAGALAKAAAGAVDAVPHARATNLSRALETLGDLGWRAVGLDGDAEASLEATLDERPTVLVLGSEGEGIRRLVAEHCDALARIAMPGGFQSLNVSAAAAVALYAASLRRAGV